MYNVQMYTGCCVITGEYIIMELVWAAINEVNGVLHLMHVQGALRAQSRQLYIVVNSSCIKV